MSILDPRLWLALILSHGLLFGAGYWRGDLAGEKSERATWQEKEERRLVAEKNAALQAIENNARIEQQQEIDKRKVVNDYQNEIATIRAAYERTTGRLRIPATACHSVATASQADSAVGVDATTPGTVELPEQVDGDLWQFARDADEVTATARALQEWARLNGFAD